MINQDDSTELNNKGPTPQDGRDTVEQTDSRTLNINTKALEIQNPSNMAIDALDPSAPIIDQAKSDVMVDHQVYEDNEPASEYDDIEREESKGTIRLEDADQEFNKEPKVSSGDIKSGPITRPTTTNGARKTAPIGSSFDQNALANSMSGDLRKKRG